MRLDHTRTSTHVTTRSVTFVHAQSGERTYKDGVCTRYYNLAETGLAPRGYVYSYTGRGLTS